MKSEYFRVIKFMPNERLLQISLDGLDDPEADIVRCEWGYDDSLRSSCRVYHGDMVYESSSFFPAVITAYSNRVHRNTLGLV